MNLPDCIRAMFAPKEPEHPGECASLLRAVSDAGGLIGEMDIDDHATPDVIRLALRKGYLSDGGGWRNDFVLTEKGERAIKRWPARL